MIIGLILVAGFSILLTVAAFIRFAGSVSTKDYKGNKNKPKD